MHPGRTAAGVAMDFDFGVILKSTYTIGPNIFDGARSFEAAARIRIDPGCRLSLGIEEVARFHRD